MSGHPQAITHPDEPVADPGLDRAQGDLEQVGYLPVAVSAVVGQGDGLPLHLGEPVQAAPYPLPVQARLHRLSDLVMWCVNLGCLVLAVGRRRGRTNTVD